MGRDQRQKERPLTKMYYWIQWLKPKRKIDAKEEGGILLFYEPPTSVVL